MYDVKGNLQQVLSRLPQGTRLVAISKYHPNEYIEAAYEEGQRVFGESHEQELRQKHETLPKDIVWHFIGHLQTNKVKQLIGKTVLIHSVDSFKLASVIDTESKKKGVVTDVLLEINIGDEESKYGIKPDEAVDFADSLRDLSNIRIRGLMTVAPICDDPEANRPYFKKMRELFVDIKSKNNDNISMDVLSMGMTLDFEAAIEEGATHVRVGTGIFGARDYGNRS